jgi:hypothetical protein
MRNFRYHRFLPVALLFFFVNALWFFPHGLTITSCISPFFYLWLLRKGHRFVLEKYFAVLFPFALVDVIQKVNHHASKDLAISGLLLMTVYVTVYAFAVAIHEMQSLEKLITTIIWINFWFALFGLVARFTPAYTIMWSIPTEAMSTTRSVRFRGFTYEPSYYATLMTPLVFYAYWRFAKKRNWPNIRMLLATLIPFAMALSFGAVGAMVAAMVIVYLYLGIGFTKYKWIVGGTIAVVALYFVLPSTSHIKQRITAVATGSDNSVNIRTIESYASAYAMARSEDIWFGIGLGESKDYGHTFVQWNTQNVPNATLPSTVATQFAETGILGLGLRFVVEIYLFIKTRPDRDPFRLSLFVWVVLYQFAGSFDSNVAEYLIWILAFSASAGFFSKPVPVPAREIPLEAVGQLT